MSVYITNKIDGQAAVRDATWENIQCDAANHRRSRVTVESWSEDMDWSEQQRKWWKGVLLPALEKDTGDSVLYWESVLKLVVLPDDFQFQTITVCGKDISLLPSIKTLGMKKMNEMIKGSVAHLRDERIYGDKFLWVTEPRRELKK